MKKGQTLLKKVKAFLKIPKTLFEKSLTLFARKHCAILTNPKSS
jgi:hypothetical protein